MRKNWMTLVVAGFLTAGLADSAQARRSRPLRLSVATTRLLIELISIPTSRAAGSPVQDGT